MSELLKGKRVTWIGGSRNDPEKKVFYLQGVEGIVDAGDCDVAALKKGVEITVEVTKQGKGYVAKRLKVTDTTPPVPKGRGSWGGGRPGGGGSAYNDPKRQASIVMQHSQEMAITAVKLILDKEIVKLPAQAKQKAVFDELLAEYTAKFFGQASGEKAAAAESAIDDEPAEETEKPTEETEAAAEFDDEFDAD